MTNTHEADLRLVLAAVDQQLPAQWQQWPGGWPEQIELALIDAVLSIRSRYGRPTTGVRKRTSLYRDHRGRVADDLPTLADMAPEHLGEVLQTKQRTGGTLKAEAITKAAQALVAVGVQRAADLDPEGKEQKAAYCSVQGLGPVTWKYLLMLVGKPGIKADTWICRFTSNAIGRHVSWTEAEALLHEAAKVLKVSPTDLDHAVWSYMSRQRA